MSGLRLGWEIDNCSCWTNSDTKRERCVSLLNPNSNCCKSNNKLKSQQIATVYMYEYDVLLLLNIIPCLLLIQSRKFLAPQSRARQPECLSVIPPSMHNPLSVFWDTQNDLCCGSASFLNATLSSLPLLI